MTTGREAIVVSRGAIPTPAFFASVSSVKANLSPGTAVAVLSQLGTPLFLVSAYDIIAAIGDERSAILRDLETARAAGAIVLVDSGNYESYWHRDAGWSVDQYHALLRDVPCDIAFTFDTHLGGSADEIIRHTLESLERDKRAVPDVLFAPIVHVAAADLVATVLVGVCGSTSLPLVAVPERELGDGISSRVGTIRRARQALEAAGLSTPVHLLGTGNPISLLAYAAAGADSFDGLEWSQTVVDHESALLHHTQQYDFFRNQTSYGDGDLPFPFAVLAHNLAFFGPWLQQIRDALSDPANATLRVRRLAAERIPANLREALMRSLESS